jgi:hypothetical protein
MVDCPRQNLPHLHMPLLTTISGSDLPRIDLSGDGIVTGMPGGLNVPNGRKHVGRKLGRLRLTSHAHAFDGPAGVEPWRPLKPQALIRL